MMTTPDPDEDWTPPSWDAPNESPVSATKYHEALYSLATALCYIALMLYEAHGPEDPDGRPT